MKPRSKALCLTIAALWSVNLFATASADEITLTDLTGRKITLAVPVERVVSIVAPTASTVIAIDGAVDKLVATNPIAIGTFKSGVIGMLLPEALGIKNDIIQSGAGAFMPNVEAIADLDPDIVIQSGFSGEDVVKPLLAAGIPTALYRWGDEAQARKVNSMIGTLLGKSGRADALNAWREETVKLISTAAADISDGERLKVLQVMATPAGYRVWGKGTIADYAISPAGGVNVASEVMGMSSVGTEQIAAWNPDVVFIFNWRGNRQAFVDHPVLGALSASQSDRVYLLPAGSVNWGSTGEDDPLYYGFVAALTYPDVHGSNIASDMNEWYSWMYGRAPTPQETATLLHEEQNGLAADYTRILGAH